MTSSGWATAWRWKRLNCRGGGLSYDNMEERPRSRLECPRSPLTETLYRRMEDAVLQLNARFFRFDLSALEQMFQYALYGGPEGGHFDLAQVDYGRDPS